MRVAVGIHNIVLVEAHTSQMDDPVYHANGRFGHGEPSFFVCCGHTVGLFLSSVLAGRHVEGRLGLYACHVHGGSLFASVPHTRPLVFCRGQCFSGNCVISTWRWWQLMPSMPPTCNCFQPLRHHRCQRNSPVTSDSLVRCCIKLPCEYQLHNPSGTGGFHQPHKAIFKASCDLVGILLWQLFDHLAYD